MSTDRALEAARRIVAWQEVAGDGPADAWPTTCGDAVDVARAFLAVKEALTPSGETKAAYIGEFKFGAQMFDDDGNEFTQEFYAPWTTTKEIMAAILKRATPPSSQPGNSEVTR